MELFKYRNLALGCALFLAFLFLSYYISHILRIILLICAVALALTSVLLYLISRRKRSLLLMLRTVPAMLFVALAMVVSSAAFKDNEKLSELCDGNAYSAVATITDISYYSNGFGIYEASLLRVEDAELDCKISLQLKGDALMRGDTVSLRGCFMPVDSPTVGFDSCTYSLGKGIESILVADSCVFIDNKPMPLLDFLDSANAFLDKQFKKIGSERTYGVLSALFLGNKENLGLDIRRDFTRIGLNHVLALSGMHITIVVTVIGFALLASPIRKLFKEIILISSTLFFVGMTGFSLSAVRAGLMVCIAYTFQFFGGRISAVSALLLSVTVICVTSPYSLFSISLILSFFAMLGCLVSSRIIKRYKLFRVFRRKVSRFVAFTFMSTVFALLFTLPIVSLVFGSFSLISPLSNIMVSPLFSILIYLCPVYLSFANVPLLSVAIKSVCKWITRLSMFLGGALADIDGVLIPILSPVQSVATVTVTGFLFFVMVTKRKHLLRALSGVGAGALVFAVGTLIFFIQRWNNIYVGAYSEDGDIVFVEDEGEITLIDMTDASTAKYILSYSVSEYLGYFEIDNYVLTTYSSKSLNCFDSLTDATVVKSVCFPPPLDEEEAEILNQLCAIAKAKGITAIVNEGTITTKNTVITFSPTTRLPRSAIRCNAFCIDCGSSRFTYLGKSSFELSTPFVETAVYTSDIVVFGDYGPDFKMNYKYKAPYIDYAVFFGETITYADKQFLTELGEKARKYNSVPLRFSLTP